MEINLEGLYAEPNKVKKVHFEHDRRESMVDIYVSAESLRVFDSPWVEEDVSPDSLGPVGTIHREFQMSAVKRSRVSSSSACLGVMCLLLLIGIISLIVKMSRDQSEWGRQRDLLLSSITNLSQALNSSCRHGGNNSFISQHPKE